MRAHVAFYLGAPDGLLGHFLAGPLHEFSAWFRQGLKADEIDAHPETPFLIEEAAAKGAVALEARDADHAERVDRMLDEYYGSFCDHVQPELITPATASALYLLRYEKLGRALSPDAQNVWDHMISGRGAGRPDDAFPYSSDDGVFRLGYWNLDEVGLLLHELQHLPRPRPLSREHAALVAIMEGLEFAVAERVGLITVVA